MDEVLMMMEGGHPSLENVENENQNFQINPAIINDLKNSIQTTTTEINKKIKKLSNEVEYYSNIVKKVDCQLEKFSTAGERPHPNMPRPEQFSKMLQKNLKNSKILVEKFDEFLRDLNFKGKRFFLKSIKKNKYLKVQSLYFFEELFNKLVLPP